MYVNNILKNKNNHIKTLAFNFDNRARLYKPDRLKHSTVTINNNNSIYLKFMNKIYESYSESIEEIDKIIPDQWKHNGTIYNGIVGCFTKSYYIGS